MKIGIMTFHTASNHGAVLQAYALQTQLQKMGHEPFFIDYQYGGRPQKGLFKWIGRTPGNTFEKLNNQFRLRPFIPFRKKHLLIGQDCYLDHSQLNDTPPEADVYICGSDQIWNPSLLNSKKDEHVFWLNFGGNKVKCLSYAPSFGAKELSDSVFSRYADYVKRLDAISVREKDGLNLLEKIGRQDAVWVPDPTLLLDPDEYRHIELRHQQSDKPYLFSYLLQTRRSSPSPSAQINAKVCLTLGLGSYESYSLSLLYNIFCRRYLNPGEWLYKLHKSSFIVTNSFHGTVFGILFNRPFITILRKGTSAGMNSRIESLLELAGLEHRAVIDFDRGHIEELCQEKIDWDRTNTKINKFRKIGIEFLASALK